MHAKHFRRRKNKSLRYIIILCLVGIVVFFGNFIYNLEDSVQTEQITERYNLDVEF